MDTEDGSARQRLLAATRAELAEQGRGAVSLRGIARRAGVSHAAPKYFFGDRAGLLTAVAAEGFDGLAGALRRAAAGAGGATLTVLGRAYVDYGRANPALFDLMFRPDELHPEDPALQEAQARAIGLLSGTVPAGARHDGSDGPPALALVSWAFAHGLLALSRTGALRAVGSEESDLALVDELIAAFDRAVS